MKTTWTAKKLVAVLIAAVLVIAGVTCAIIFSGKSKNQDPETTQEATTVASNTDPTAEPTTEAPTEPGPTDEEMRAKGYYQVKFAVPANVTDKQKGSIVLPETTWVEPGTKLNTLTSARQNGAVFLGWYYDDKLTGMIGPNDVADRDVTLYPRFDKSTTIETEFSEDYIAHLNVGSDFRVLISAHNLSPEDIRKKIIVRDLTSVCDITDYKLVNINDAQGSATSEDPNKEFILFDADKEAELKKLLADMDEEVLAVLYTSVFMDGFSGIPDLNAYYGLEENDSPERYWREELGLSPEQVEDLSKAANLLIQQAYAKAETYVVVPSGEKWEEGHMFQVEILDTTCLRFQNDNTETGDRILFHNFTVYKKDFNNLQLAPSVVFIAQSDVEGITDLKSLYTLVASNDGETETRENSKSGTLTYKKAPLTPGTVVAIYNGELKEGGIVDGDVGYYKITEDLGNAKYAYDGADFTDVIWIPDIIPLPDDGNYNDRQYKITAAQLQFPGALNSELGLTSSTKVDVGDFVCFYTGAATKFNDLQISGIGRITKAEASGNDIIVSYEPASMEDIDNSAGMYMSVVPIELPVSSIDQDAMKLSMEKQLLDSGFVMASAKYVTDLIDGKEKLPDDPEMAEAIKKLTFKTDTGEELTLDQIRNLGNGTKSVTLLDGPTVAMELNGNPTHFKSSDFEFDSGLRIVLNAGFKLGIALNDDSSIEIQLNAGIEQEFVLGYGISVKKEHCPLEFVVDASLRAGTYTGFGIEATIMTKGENPNKDTEWGRLLDSTGASKGNKRATQALLDLGNELEDLSEKLDKIQNGATVSKTGKQSSQTQYTGDYEGPMGTGKSGDLPTKYAEMLGNDAEYIDIVKWTLFEAATSFDPLHLIEFSVQADLVVSCKLNAMVGFSVSYANAKQYNYHIRVRDREAYSSKGDLVTPNFRADFFVFGMAGLRAGVRLDARVGVISTKFDSIGITAEVGFYAEFYGFFYVYYYWQSGSEPDSGMLGSLLLEIGTYLEIKFVAQIGDGKISKSIDLYSKKWPLKKWGTAEALVPYVETDEDAVFQDGLEFPEGANTIKVPDNVFGVDLMSLSTGEVRRESMDSDKNGSYAYGFEINGRNYDQYNEQFFNVSCCDLESEFGKVTNDHSFRYLPSTNEIVVKPVDDSKDELWGLITFTYKGKGFGFSNVVLCRSLKVHWKGTPAKAVVEYYLQNEDDRSSYDLVDSETLTGYNGVQYDMFITKAFCDKYVGQGYVIDRMELPDEETMRQKVADLKKEYEEANKKAKDYKKNNGRSDYKLNDAAQFLLDDKNIAQKLLDNYINHKKNCVAQKSGTVYFMMTDGTPKIRVYYKIAEYRIFGYVMNYDGENLKDSYERDYLFSTETVRMSQPVKEKLVAAISDRPKEKEVLDQIKWYYFTYAPIFYEFTEHRKALGIKGYSHSDVIDYLKEYHLDELKPLEEGAVAPQDEIFAIGFIIPPKYKLTWMLEDEVIKEEMIVADMPIPEVPGEFYEREKPGYAFKDGWWRSDGEHYWPTYNNNLFFMPYHDLVIHGFWTPEYQVIHWDTGTSQWETKNIRTGELISKEWPPTFCGRGWGDNEREGHTLTWRIVIDGEEKDFSMDMVMPAGGVTMKAVYTINDYTVTWKDGDRVVKTETLPYGTKLTAPEVKPGEDETISWWDTDGYPLLDNTKLYGHDTTYVVRRHKHQWEFARVFYEPDCSNKGADWYGCSCGESKLVETEPNDVHHWTPEPYKSDEGTCVKGRVDYYYCYRCHKEKKVETGELDPNNHEGPAVFHDGVEPTCTKDGSSWYYSCEACGKQTTEPTVIKATGHSYVYETQPSTCTTQGKKIGTCEECGDVTTELLPLDDTKHEWGDVQYVWAADNSTVTAKRVCKNNPKHVEQETVGVTGTVFIAPTCDAKGTTKYTSKTFSNSLFKVQTKTVEDIPAKGHTWKTTTYTWSDDNSKVTAFHECSNDGSHVEQETVNTTVKETTISGTLDVQREYTATFKNGSFATQKKKVTITSDWVLMKESPYAEYIGLNNVYFYKVIIHRGRNIKKNAKTGEIVTLADTDDVLITPKLKTNTVPLSKLDASGGVVTAQMLRAYLFGADKIDETDSNLYSQVYIDIPTSTDGTGSFRTNLPFDMSWASGYSDISYDTLKSNIDKNGSYSVKVKIRVVYGSLRDIYGKYDPSEMTENTLGHASESDQGLDLEGNTADFKEITAEIKITK
ncbi:MAG: hypothetical protein IKX10_00910 [Lachnospiraceae bacterium]|nr:hypothetical protein [Lachnospiraceae bacterium]